MSFSNNFVLSLVREPLSVHRDDPKPFLKFWIRHRQTDPQLAMSATRETVGATTQVMMETEL